MSPSYPPQTVVEFCAPTELFPAEIDLHDRRMLREKLPVRKVRSEHQAFAIVRLKRLCRSSIDSLSPNKWAT